MPNRRMGQARGRQTILECIIAAFPQTVNYWEKDGRKLSSSAKYHVDVYDDGNHRIVLYVIWINWNTHQLTIVMWPRVLDRHSTHVLSDAIFVCWALLPPPLASWVSFFVDFSGLHISLRPWLTWSPLETRNLPVYNVNCCGVRSWFIRIR